MRNPRQFAQPLALGAPDPLLEVPFRPSRMIHFFDASNPKMAAKVPDMAKQADILLGNLEDAVSVDNKVAAREGLVQVANDVDFGDTQLWTRVNSLESPWVLDDITQLVTEIGDRLDVMMVPKVEGPWDIHYVDRLLAQLEAKNGLERPILIHAILETGLGVVNLEEIATASPRMQGMSFGPADLAASRRMKTTRVGGGHPGYRVIEDPDPEQPEAPRVSAQQDPWHYSIARMVDACAATGRGSARGDGRRAGVPARRRGRRRRPRPVRGGASRPVRRRPARSRRHPPPVRDRCPMTTYVTSALPRIPDGVDRALTPITIQDDAGSDGLAKAAIAGVARLATENGHRVAVPPEASLKLDSSSASSDGSKTSPLLFVLPALLLFAGLFVAGRVAARRQGSAPAASE